MSASPSGLSNGQTPTPNGGPPQFIRKAKPVDPLRPRKKPPRRPNLPPGLSTTKPNGLVPAGRPTAQPPSNGAGPARGPPHPSPANGTNASQTYGGWTHPPAGEVTDFPLLTTKRALREGLRYHIAKFNSKKDVDPENQDEFTRPVALHRRDPRAATSDKDGKLDEMEDVEIMDSKEREKAEIAKAEKDARKAADLAQIAPSGNNASAVAKRGQVTRLPKTQQIHRTDQNEEDKKKSDLKYEEALPWHLEDAEGKNAWFGNYEAALSDTNVMFVVEGSTFRMIPIEKWYKFTQKAQFKTLTIDEAESRMSKGAKESRWSMQSQEKAKLAKEAQESRSLMLNGGNANRSLYMVKGESTSFKNSSKREIEDADELDFEAEDLFQDDDEQATVEPDQDEEVKEAQGRIKKNQLGANFFGQVAEAEVDKELAEEKKEEERRKLLGKGLTKALKKREKNYIYDSDKSSNPFESSSSDDDTSDEEKQKEIDKRKDEEAKNKAKLESKLPSGASSKGTNTPSGRPKHSDPLKRAKNLKRPGSPNLSESSGNESSRKKHKKKHASSQPTGTSTPIPGSRPMSPAPSAPQPASNQSPRKSSIVKLTVAPSKLSEIQSAPPNPSPVQGNAMTDGEVTGGEMSDVSRKKKIKIRIGGTPSGSRAGSPAPGRAGSIGAGGSRAGSPAAQTQTTGTSRAQSPPVGAGLIRASEIQAALPAAGITIGALLKLFENRVGDVEGLTSKKNFINMVKNNSAYAADKLLRPKPENQR